MKKEIYSNREMSAKMRKNGRKTRSHSSCKAKRHPTSPRLKAPYV